MTARNKSAQARVGFRFLAGLLAVLFFVGVYRSVNFALDDKLPSTQRWGGVSTAALFLFVAVGFAYGALTGRWITAKGSVWTRRK